MSIDKRSMASEESRTRPDIASSSPTLHILADTNVVLDLLLGRQPWLAAAQPMWEARDTGRLRLYLPASALTDIFYVARKLVGFAGAKHVVETCLLGFSIVGVDRHILAAALTLPGNDYEDNVQIACAQSAALDLIVTRNRADFAHSPILAVEPAEILRRLSQPLG
ncbi:MAG TPA: PIN domain-containing protein [Chloroflexota bacterium]|nr:PIN domain-containing protein [Chloroflexota bacterium]